MKKCQKAESVSDASLSEALTNQFLEPVNLVRQAAKLAAVEP